MHDFSKSSVWMTDLSSWGFDILITGNSSPIVTELFFTIIEPTVRNELFGKRVAENLSLIHI